MKQVKVIRISGYSNFADTLEKKINETLTELQGAGANHKIILIQQSLTQGISDDGITGKHENLHALVTIIYE